MKEKELYLAPECEEIHLCTEGTLASSPGYSLTPGNPFGGNTEENWYNS